jgi:hypothetical protein
VTRRVALAALLSAQLAAAQGRPHRRGPQPRPAGLPLTLRVTAVEHASAPDARLAAPAVLPAIARCLAEARSVDPAPIAALRRVDLVLRLRPDGRAAAVEFDQDLRARGLSACLGDALLTWRQARVRHPRAAVHLALELRPP